MAKQTVLPLAYFPDIFYMSQVVGAKSILLETNEFFEKKTIRNRCDIAGANGKQKLSVPVKNINSKKIISEVEISYADSWQHKHFKAIESAYGLSPFYEFYIDDFLFVFENKFEKIADLNIAILNKIIEILEVDVLVDFTKTYISAYKQTEYHDFRFWYSKANKDDGGVAYPVYTQVFTDKNGFLSNLSILDLLFNLGPETEEYLLNLFDKTHELWKKQ